LAKAAAIVQVKFLRYIREWGKKVVFVVNKVDIFDDPKDIDQVTEFVAANARTLLGVDTAMVHPVSARLALAAKLAAGSGERGGVLGGPEGAAALARDERWAASRFHDLEHFMLDFLTGARRNHLCRLHSAAMISPVKCLASAACKHLLHCAKARAIAVHALTCWQASIEGQSLRRKTIQLAHRFGGRWRGGQRGRGRRRREHAAQARDAALRRRRAAAGRGRAARHRARRVRPGGALRCECLFRRAYSSRAQQTGPCLLRGVDSN
jgi:hypothetical protein